MLFKCVLRAVVTLSLISATFTTSAAVIGYTNQATFATAAGGVTVETFEGLALGAISSLPSLNIGSMSGLGGQFIGSSAALPFPMFVPPLPSGTKFLSNNMASPTFATGSIDFFFNAPITAVGAFVADSAPLGGFSIEVFIGNASQGIITVGARTLPDSFVGITSNIAFDHARFLAVSAGDSWGLDNLQVNSATRVPEPASLALISLGLLGLCFSRRKQG